MTDYTTQYSISENFVTISNGRVTATNSGTVIISLANVTPNSDISLTIDDDVVVAISELQAFVVTDISFSSNFFRKTH
jgi:hypothetical protein